MKPSLQLSQKQNLDSSAASSLASHKNENSDLNIVY